MSIVVSQPRDSPLTFEGVTIFQIPYFDSGDLKHGERASHLQSKNEKRNATMNVHVQRTLNESYYLGLNGEQLEKRRLHDSDILNQEKFSPMSDNILLVSQLWLLKIDNIVITAFPREEEYKSSNLYDHTLSLLRDIGTDTRMQLTSDHFAAWVFSECIHRLDYPCIADLEEPILYFLGKVVAVTLAEVEEYLKKDGLRNIHIEQEKKYIEQISVVRSKITMIKNIVLRQEEVWDTFNKELSSRIFGNDSDKGPLTKIKDINLRPLDDFARLKHRIARIEEDSARVGEIISAQLDLRVKHAGLRESHNSLILSMAVIGFTAITIIFTPLSFLASLFALPIDQFHSHQISGNVYKSDYIATWMGKSLLDHLFRRLLIKRGVTEVVSLVLTAAFVKGAMLVIQPMQKIPSQILRPAIKKILSQLWSYFKKEYRATKAAGKLKGAKPNEQMTELRAFNNPTLTPTNSWSTKSTSRHGWNSRASKGKATANILPR
jgi:hypothetical protein